MIRTFTSNKSVLLGGLLFGIVGLYFYGSWESIRNMEVGPTVIALFMILIFGGLLFGIRYQINGEHLLVKLGPFITYKILISEIDTISRSYNAISSPAASLRRIELRYGKYGVILLSPRNEKEFIKSLRKINPKIYNNVPSEEAAGLIGFLYWLL